MTALLETHQRKSTTYTTTTTTTRTTATATTITTTYETMIRTCAPRSIPICMSCPCQTHHIMVFVNVWIRRSVVVCADVCVTYHVCVVWPCLTHLFHLCVMPVYGYAGMHRRMHIACLHELHRHNSKSFLLRAVC